MKFEKRLERNCEKLLLWRNPKFRIVMLIMRWVDNKEFSSSLKNNMG
jgi:hypothetical protein